MNAWRPAPLLLGMGWFPDQPGGLNRYLYDLLDALEAAGARPRAVVVGRVLDDRDDVVAVAGAGDSLVRRLRAVARAAGELSPGASVVDAHFALYAFAPVVLGRLRRAPLVVHFHGPWADESVAAGDRSGTRAALRRRLERAVYRRADEVVVLSRAFGRLVVERYGVSPWRVSVVPPGVGLERFSPGDRAAARERLGLAADGHVALSVRRLVSRMGLDVLLDAWAQLPGERMLLIAGEGPLQSALEQRARSLGIQAAVRFLGRVGEDDLVDCYRAADVCVLPSLRLEGFGLTALEALACSTPVVGSDSGGLPELLAPLDPRSIVPAGDASALASRLAARGDLPSRSACRRYAEQFSWQRAVERHLELYERARVGRAKSGLKVVFLDHTARLSGGELALLRLLPALDVDAHVIMAEDGPLVAKLTAAGISVEVLPMAESARGLGRSASRRRAAAATPASALYALRLAARLRRLQPDLVHTNSLKSALYGGVAARLAGVPAVWHIRDRIAEDYLSPRAVRLVHLAARRLPAAVIANSSATLATLGRLRVPGHVVPSPVAAAAPHAPPRSGPLRAGIVGRIAPWKGQHVFIEAFARAFATGDERGVVVGAPLFGREEEEYFDRLRSLAEEHGLGDRIEFTGFCDDVDAELAKIDVLVHASVLPEPYGQVVVEGMAHGLPVIAAAVGGPSEVIADGVNGILYTPGDAGALARALQRVAAAPDLRAQLGARAREAAQEFSPERVAARVKAVYTEVATR